MNVYRSRCSLTFESDARQRFRVLSSGFRVVILYPLGRAAARPYQLGALRLLGLCRLVSDNAAWERGQPCPRGLQSNQSDTRVSPERGILVFHLVSACFTLFQLSGKKLERTSPRRGGVVLQLVAACCTWLQLVAACCTWLQLSGKKIGTGRLKTDVFSSNIQQRASSIERLSCK